MATSIVLGVAMEAVASAPVRLALLEPTDGAALERFFFRLSPETLYRRYLSPICRPEQARLAQLLEVDHRDREALVGLVDEEIVGIASYARYPGTDAADVAVVVADAWQRQGIASYLLSALAAAAAAVGICQFTVMLQADNRPVLALLRRFVPSARLSLSHGVYEGCVLIPSGGR